jgi:putative ubiquitin-RnfH superfamily antitoxin RatB of RatAB toxin-antitoxin module
VSRFGIGAAFVVVVGVLCLVAIYFLKHDPPAEDPASAASVAGTSQQAPEYPRAVVEDKGRIEIVRPVKVDLPPTIVEPLFESDMRVPIGEPAQLKFAARDRASGRPLSGATVTASVVQGAGPARPLPLEEVEDGVFEVPFKPQGPGRFQVALNVDGVMVGSRSVGVVGAAGANDGTVDIVNPLSVDPREPRSRTSGRSRRR